MLEQPTNAYILDCQKKENRNFIIIYHICENSSVFMLAFICTAAVLALNVIALLSFCSIQPIVALGSGVCLHTQSGEYIPWALLNKFRILFSRTKCEPVI